MYGGQGGQRRCRLNDWLVWWVTSVDISAGAVRCSANGDTTGLPLACPNVRSCDCCASGIDGGTIGPFFEFWPGAQPRGFECTVSAMP